jgi:peptidoglycan/LPS O-acetylase OafA/YrhL
VEAALFLTGSFPSSVFSAGSQIGWHVTLFVSGSNSSANLIFPWPFKPDHFFKFFPSGVLWTITAELQFYLLIPLIIAGLERLNGLRFYAIAALFAASVTSGLYCDRAAASGYYSPLFEFYRLSVGPYLWIFMVGVALEFYWTSVRKMIEGRAIFWLIVYLIAFPVGADFMNPVPLAALKTCVLVCTIISMAYTLRRTATILAGVDLSYGIYLYHMPVVWTLLWLGLDHSGLLWLLVAIITFGFAAASWFYVERIALRYKRDAIPRGSRVKAAPEPA